MYEKKGQQNRIENVEIDPTACGNLVFNKRGISNQWRIDGLFNECWDNLMAIWKKKWTNSSYHITGETANKSDLILKHKY